MDKKYIRNIGICAHIDAGKTTFTERILFYTGKKHKMGEVHDGEATMDWMDQEQERGITINSASTTVFWNGIYKEYKLHKINIIDTPGHVDFTAEVERSMRVLDGACILFCSVSGVQAQSETVWNQMNKYKIPRIAFINKMDREGADYSKVCDQINKIFGIIVLKMNFPLFKKGKFVGIIDIIEMKSYFYDEKSLGKNIFIEDVNEKIKKKIILKRKKIIEKVAVYDDNFLEKYLNNEITNYDIKLLIRKKTIDGTVIPVFCGSAFKNKGIQNILNHIIDFLPFPKNYFISKNLPKNTKYHDLFFSFVFKITNDSYSGKLSYIRIYSGSLKTGDFIYNQRTKKKEKISRIIQIHANVKKDLKYISEGDISAIVGPKDIKTGDTLCSGISNFSFEKIKFPDPVISVSVFSKASSDQEKLINSIKKLSLEDQTISYSVDKDDSRIILAGMGELHIEVFLERIKREYNVDFFVSKPKVSYKETIEKKSLNIEGKYIRQSGGRGQYGHVVINIFPRKLGKGFKFINSIKGGTIPKEYIKHIKKSFIDGLKRGVLLGFNVVDIKIELIFGSYHEVDSNENAFRIASSIALREALKKSNPVILEPIMKVEIRTPVEYIGTIMSDISSKRGNIFYNKNKNNYNVIKSFVPLSEMFNYSTSLRSKTKGRASYNMEFNCYKKLPKNIFYSILKTIK